MSEFKKGGIVKTMTVPHPNGGEQSEAIIEISTDLVRAAPEQSQ